MATEIHGTAVKDEFKEHWMADQRHADTIAEPIRQLGASRTSAPTACARATRNTLRARVSKGILADEGEHADEARGKK